MIQEDEFYCSTYYCMWEVNCQPAGQAEKSFYNGQGKPQLDIYSSHRAPVNAVHRCVQTSCFVMAFLRIRLCEAIVDHTKPNDPFCAVNIKEAITDGDGAVSLQQKKKTFYPVWGRCFDSHLKSGRRMQILIMDRADVPGADATPVAEVSVETEHLAHECSDEDQGVAVKLAVSLPCMQTLRPTRLVKSQGGGVVCAGQVDYTAPPIVF